MPRLTAVLCALVAVAALAGGCAEPDTGSPGAGEPTSPTVVPTAVPTATAPTVQGSAPAPEPPTAPVTTSDPPSPGPPLAGRVVVLDPGHQLGNGRHLSQINRPVDAGGFTKPCNTTGTATGDGYPEATFTWEVAVRARRILRDLGAEVLMTRDENSADGWGPCIDVRGRVGNPGQPGPDADVRISIHGDGSLSSGAHGFHVIMPGERRGWTDDIVRPSEQLAIDVRDALVAAGFTPSTYRGDAGLDVRTDLGTLNHSDVPVVMAELGNMRHSGDAAVMTSAAGQRRYAEALAAAVRTYLAPGG